MITTREKEQQTNGNVFWFGFAFSTIVCILIVCCAMIYHENKYHQPICYNESIGNPNILVCSRYVYGDKLSTVEKCVNETVQIKKKCFLNGIEVNKSHGM